MTSLLPRAEHGRYFNEGSTSRRVEEGRGRGTDGDVGLSSLKRLLDLSGATVLLLLFLPVLVIAAIAIRLETRGGVLFSQRRTGLNGSVFRIYKLRTMRVAEDGDAIRHASRGDARITRVGAFLRRTSIDELPQLINVFEGSMSLVGPRPHAVAHDVKYSALIPAYAHRFRARPGITGLAQISGWRGEIHTVRCMAERVKADNAYIDNWSIADDIRILLGTVRSVVADDKAY